MRFKENHQIQVKIVGKMPPYYKVAEALWGKGANIDSDGNSMTPDDRKWTELTLTLRARSPSYKDPIRLDIDPKNADGTGGILVLRSNDREIVEKAFEFLVSTGSIQRIGG